MTRNIYDLNTLMWGLVSMICSIASIQDPNKDLWIVGVLAIVMSIISVIMSNLEDRDVAAEDPDQIVQP